MSGTGRNADTQVVESVPMSSKYESISGRCYAHLPPQGSTVNISCRQMSGHASSMSTWGRRPYPCCDRDASSIRGVGEPQTEVLNLDSFFVCSCVVNNSLQTTRNLPHHVGDEVNVIPRTSSRRTPLGLYTPSIDELFIARYCLRDIAKQPEVDAPDYDYYHAAGERWESFVEERSTTRPFGPGYSSDNAGDGPEEKAEIKLNIRNPCLLKHDCESCTHYHPKHSGDTTKSSAAQRVAKKTSAKDDMRPMELCKLSVCKSCTKFGQGTMPPACAEHHYHVSGTCQTCVTQSYCSVVKQTSLRERTEAKDDMPQPSRRRVEQDCDVACFLPASAPIRRETNVLRVGDQETLTVVAPGIQLRDHFQAPVRPTQSSSATGAIKVQYLLLLLKVFSSWINKNPTLAPVPETNAAAERPLSPLIPEPPVFGPSPAPPAFKYPLLEASERKMVTIGVKDVGPVSNGVVNWLKSLILPYMRHHLRITDLPDLFTNKSYHLSVAGFQAFGLSCTHVLSIIEEAYDATIDVEIYDAMSSLIMGKFCQTTRLSNAPKQAFAAIQSWLVAEKHVPTYMTIQEAIMVDNTIMFCYNVLYYRETRQALAQPNKKRSLN